MIMCHLIRRQQNSQDSVILCGKPLHREEQENSLKVFCYSFVLIICFIACFHLIQSLKKLNVISDFTLAYLNRNTWSECIWSLFTPYVKTATSKEKSVKQILVFISKHQQQKLWDLMKTCYLRDLLLIASLYSGDVTGEMWCSELFILCSFWADYQGCRENQSCLICYTLR